MKAQGNPFRSPPVAAFSGLQGKSVCTIFEGRYFTGPLFVKCKTGINVKSYLALFTHCVTRAVHLDLVADLTATTFLRCLGRALCP